MNIIWRTEQERAEDIRAREELQAMGDAIALFLTVISVLAVYFAIWRLA